MKRKVCILGHFGYGKDLLNGQTIKTKILTTALVNQLGKTEVSCLDTHGGIKTLLKAPLQVLKALKTSENIIMLPAHNGLRVFGVLLPVTGSLFCNRKLHYVVIGGWLPVFLEKRPVLKRCLMAFDGIYVETKSMKQMLEKQGFSNIYLMPNCKELKVLKPEELVVSHTEPYRLCTFSRVMQEKGIGDAVEAVKNVNEHIGRTVCTLDIYGQIDAAQQQWFDQLEKDFPDYIRYGGLVPYDRSVEVLKDYFALLFPTCFYTEGIPGTIIDAYAAGVPVIAARWESFSDLIEENVTGKGYPMKDTAAFYNCILEMVRSPQQWNAMRINCLNEAKKYRPETVIQELICRF